MARVTQTAMHRSLSRLELSPLVLLRIVLQQLAILLGRVQAQKIVATLPSLPALLDILASKLLRLQVTKAAQQHRRQRRTHLAITTLLRTVLGISRRTTRQRTLSPRTLNRQGTVQVLDTALGTVLKP